MRKWLLGARLRTLPAGVCPVIGAYLFLLRQSFDPKGLLEAALCFLTALFLQAFANFANDYSDGIRGTDFKRTGGEGADRGPIRLLASGLASEKELKRACLLCGCLCAGFGISACAVAQNFNFIFVGAACLLAGWFYVGGKRPYGYMALGELAVMFFFGFVDTMGSGYLISESVSMPFNAFSLALLSLCFGLNSVSVLCVNNFRDKETDRVAGKMTLAVFMGKSYAFFLPVFLFFSLLSMAFLMGRFRYQFLAYLYVACDLGVILLCLFAFWRKKWKTAMLLLSARFFIICGFLALELV